MIGRSTLSLRPAPRRGGLGQVPTGAASGGGTGVPQLSNEQWYELIALASNQPLASVQSLYAQNAAGSNLTNLQIAIGQWPGGIAHSGYAMYQQGAIVDAPTGGHYYQYGSRGASWASTGAVNQWAIPSTAVQASTTATTTASGTTNGTYNTGQLMPQLVTGNGTTGTTSTNFFTGSTILSGVPNWVVLGGGAGVLLLLFVAFGHHGR